MSDFLCTRNPVPLSIVCAVPVPPATESYIPVPHGKFIERIRGIFEDRTGMVVESERYGLTTSNQRMFGTMRMRYPGDTQGIHGLSVGFRGSYDRSVAVGIAIGADVFVCDNMCFSGDSVTFMRRHTTNIWRDLNRIIEDSATKAIPKYERITADLDKLQHVPISDNRAFELLGTALGNDVLTSTQVNTALREWKEPSHEEFSDRNLWAWYNACNEALKTTPAHQMITRHTRLHSLAMAEAA